MLQVRIKKHILNLRDLVVRVVNNFEVGWSGKIEHLLQAVVAGVKLNQVLNVRQVHQ